MRSVSELEDQKPISKEPVVKETSTGGIKKNKNKHGKGGKMVQN